ncbi:MAG: zinc-binding dehydrogenase [Vulcanimicrobiaceae bacterium]
MRAVRLHEVNGPQALRVDEVDRPHPAAGEVLVRLRAAALNHRDLFITRGLYPNIALPASLGSDGAGEVAECGAQVTSVRAGDAVVIDPMLGWGGDSRVWSAKASILGMPHPGTLADYIVVPAGNVYPKPAHLAFEAAAALPLGGLTAYRALVTRGAVARGETVLLTGAGGGVQTFALLFAKALGARVIATTGGAQKCARALALGADVAIDYRADAQWAKSARAAAPEGIALAVDSVGGETFAKMLTAVRPGGRVVTYGGTSGDATLKMFPIFWNHLTICGTSMGSPADFAGMLALVSGERLEPIVDRVFALEEIVAAAQRLERGEQFGKVVVSIA